jgi:hypothetical protein
VELNLEELLRLQQRDRKELELCRQVFPVMDWSGIARQYQGKKKIGRHCFILDIRLLSVWGQQWSAGLYIENHKHHLVYTTASTLEDVLKFLEFRVDAFIGALCELKEKNNASNL